MRRAWVLAAIVIAGCSDDSEQTPVGPLMIDLGDHNCVEHGKNEVHDFIVQEDGTKLRCRHNPDNGGGFLPTGITFDTDACATVGSIDDKRAGVWAIVVEVTQSDVTQYVPLCVSQTASQSPYTIDVTPASLGEGTYAATQPLSFGGGKEPKFVVTAPDDCPSDTCIYGVSISGALEPFQTMTADPLETLDPGSAGQLRLQHGLTGGAVTVDPMLAGRPLVVSLDVDYCFSAYGGECDDANQSRANSEPGTHYSILLADEQQQ